MAPDKTKKTQIVVGGCGTGGLDRCAVSRRGSNAGPTTSSTSTGT
jgi:hypothetical protein